MFRGARVHFHFTKNHFDTATVLTARVIYLRPHENIFAENACFLYCRAGGVDAFNFFYKHLVFALKFMFYLEMEEALSPDGFGVKRPPVAEATSVVPVCVRARVCSFTLTDRALTIPSNIIRGCYSGTWSHKIYESQRVTIMVTTH